MPGPRHCVLLYLAHLRESPPTDADRMMLEHALKELDSAHQRGNRELAYTISSSPARSHRREHTATVFASFGELNNSVDDDISSGGKYPQRGRHRRVRGGCDRRTRLAAGGRVDEA